MTKFFLNNLYKIFCTESLCTASGFILDWLCITINALFLSLLAPSTNGLSPNYSSLCVFLHPAKMADVPAGRILSIEIETDREYRYSFKRNLKCPHHVMIEKSSPEFCSLPSHYVLDKDVSGQSLVKEICHKGTSQHYLKLLTLLSKINSECLR